MKADPTRCNSCTRPKDPRDGYAICEGCRAKRAEYHQRKKDDPTYRARRNKNRRDWWEQDGERLRAKQRERYAADPEKFKEGVRRYQEENADLVREWKRIQRARRQARNHGVFSDLTLTQWRWILDCYEGLCAYCEEAEATDIEHVVALSKGGENTAANVVPACHPCNASKGDRGVTEWLAGRCAPPHDDEGSFADEKPLPPG